MPAAAALDSTDVIEKENIIDPCADARAFANAADCVPCDDVYASLKTPTPSINTAFMDSDDPCAFRRKDAAHMGPSVPCSIVSDSLRQPPPVSYVEAPVTCPAITPLHKVYSPAQPDEDGTISFEDFCTFYDHVGEAIRRCKGVQYELLSLIAAVQDGVQKADGVVTFTPAARSKFDLILAIVADLDDAGLSSSTIKSLLDLNWDSLSIVS